MLSVGPEREAALLPGWFMWLLNFFSKTIDVEISSARIPIRLPTGEALIAVRVLLVDDHAIVRAGFRRLIG